LYGEKKQNYYMMRDFWDTLYISTCHGLLAFICECIAAKEYNSFVGPPLGCYTYIRRTVLWGALHHEAHFQFLRKLKNF